MVSLNKTTEKGFLMIDVLVGLAVATVLILAFMSAVVFSTQASAESTARLQANVLAVELVEILRDIEQTATSDPFGSCVSACHPENNAGSWDLQSGAATELGAYTRSLRIDAVSRDDTTHEVVESGGTVDPDTFKATITVSWNTQRGPGSMTLESYVYDRYEQW